MTDFLKNNTFDETLFEGYNTLLIFSFTLFSTGYPQHCIPQW